MAWIARIRPAVALVLAGSAHAQELLVNGDAEAGDLTGWIVDGSEFPAGGAAFAAAHVSNGTLPFEGAWMFIMDAAATGTVANSGVIARMRQTVNLFDPRGSMRLGGALMSQGGTSCDPGRVVLSFVDADGEPVGSGIDTGWILSFAWREFEESVLIPEGAAQAQLTLMGRLNCGVYIDTYFDDMSLSICEPDLNADGGLDFFDVQRFLNQFAAHESAADWTGDETLDFFDVQAFLQAFSSGCP